MSSYGKFHTGTAGRRDPDRSGYHLAVNRHGLMVGVGSTILSHGFVHGVPPAVTVAVSLVIGQLFGCPVTGYHGEKPMSTMISS